MTDEIIREYTVGEFRGSFPDVPIEQGVLDALKELEANPFYATLPIVPEVGAISNNGLLYDEELVSSIERQINENKPGGILGHLKDSERDTAFPLPSGMWLGAKREGNTLWGKAYVPSGPVREHIRTLMAVGGRIATSIYGRAKKFEKVRDGVKRAIDFKLESLDFAPPSRAALGYGAIPHVTSEMEQDSEQEPIMADKAQVIAELTVADIPATLREQIVAEASKQSEDATVVAELTTQLSARDDRITVLETTVQEFRRREFVRVVEEKVAELTNWTVSDTEKDANGKTGKDKLAALRAMFKRAILEKVGAEQDVDSVAEMALQAWEEIKPIAEMMRDALAGPAAIVRGRVAAGAANGAIPKLEDTPENRAQAAAAMGIAI